LFRRGYDLDKSEIGCALSHLKFYSEMINLNLPVSVVVEDDVSFAASFAGAVNEAKNFLAQTHKPTIVQFPGLQRDLPVSIAESADQFVKVSSAMGSYAYAINIEGARALRSIFSPICMPIDSYGYVIKHFGFDYFVYNGLTLSVNNAQSESTIGGDRFVRLGNPLAKIAWKAWRAVGVGIDSLLK